MEIIIGIAVIFVLMLCLGAGFQLIASIALGLLGLFIVFMALVFIYAFLVMAGSRRTHGRYTRYANDEKSRIPYAYYVINGVEFKNMFPMEVIFQKRIYKSEKEIKLLFNARKKRCFDNNAVICCILGIAVSVFLLVEMVFLITGNL